MHGRHGTHGAVVAAWRDGASRPPSEEARRLLRLMAQTAAGALARFRPPDSTHAELRTRVDGLEAVAKLAARLADAGDEAAVLAGAGRGRDRRRPLRRRRPRPPLGVGLGREVRRGARRRANSANAWAPRAVCHVPGRVVRVPLSDDTAAVVVATDDGSALLVGRRWAAAGRLDECFRACSRM